MGICRHDAGSSHPMLCQPGEVGWVGGGREAQEGRDICNMSDYG